MDALLAIYFLATVATAPAQAPMDSCTVGYTVMVPDGREGRVTSADGDICRVLAEGEDYVSLLPHYLVEPVYPQAFLKRTFGH